QDVVTPELLADGQVGGQVKRPVPLKDFVRAAGRFPAQAASQQELGGHVLDEGVLEEAAEVEEPFPRAANVWGGQAERSAKPTESVGFVAVEVGHGVTALVEADGEPVRQRHRQADPINLEIPTWQGANGGRPGAAKDGVQLRHGPRIDVLERVAEEADEVGKV